MANLPLAFAEVLIGGVILTAGVTGKSPSEVIQGEISGPSGSGSGSGTRTTSAGSTSTVEGSVTTADLDKVAAGFNWNALQVADWMHVISDESGGNPNAVNSSSGAYGIGQFLAQGGSPTNLAPNEDKYYSYGGNPNSVMGQLEGMANYIKERYGNPGAALESENVRGWY